jgi:hypothetical protein
MDYPHNMGEDQCQQVINIQGRDKKNTVSNDGIEHSYQREFNYLSK